MPEGDTVWLTARRLHEALGGRPLVHAELRVPSLATVDLTRRTVREVVARGKHLLTRFDDGRTLHTHLRMEGSWRVHRSSARWTGGPDWQIRAILGAADNTAVGYRLGVVELLPTANEHALVGHLGPDLLGADWDGDEAIRRLGQQPGREIGDALLDQRNLAGIGNLYKAETLFLRGISPWTHVGDVPDLRRTVDLSRELLVANRDRWEQVTTGDRRKGRTTWVFEREGRPCRRCDATIRVAWQGEAPKQRLSYWCPRCQPGPAPSEGIRPRRTRDAYR